MDLVGYTRGARKIPKSVKLDQVVVGNQQINNSYQH